MRTRKPAPRIAAFYVRVSSRAQDYGMQIHALETAARNRGDVVGEVFREKRSAKSIARPELDRLRACAARGEIGRLYVYRIDRLCRTGIRDTIDVVHELRAAGVELVSIADGFQVDGPASELVMAVLAWAAEFERRVTGERIAAARDVAEARGRPWGRPPRMTPAQVARARRLRAEGRTFRSIAMALRVPRTVVARAIGSAPP